MCCEFLKKQLDPTNCLGIRAFADTHSCRELLRVADKYTYNNIQDVSRRKANNAAPSKLSPKSELIFGVRRVGWDKNQHGSCFK